MIHIRHLLAGTGLALALALGPVAVQAQEVITLGAAVSLTGKYSTNGKNTKDGYDLGVKVINEAGGVKVGDKTYKLEIKYYDDESTPARGAELLERLINQDGIKFVLGPYSSGMTKAMAPVTEQHKIPMVEANGAARELFTKGYKYLFAVLSTSDKYLTTAIDLAAENASKLGKDAKDLKVAIIVENDPFSQDVRAGILDDAKKYGMEVVMDDQFPKELSDISASLTKVKALKPDILVVSGHAKGASTAVQQIDAMKADAPVIAMTHCDSAQVAEKFGKAAEYILCAQQWHPELTYQDRWFENSKNYVELFKADYDYDPPYQAAESTAAVEVFADAFERAGTLDTEKLRDALAATDMETFYGNIKFDETGKNTAKPMVLTQILKGEYVLVAPSKWAATEAVIPAPGWDER